MSTSSPPPTSKEMADNKWSKTAGSYSRYFEPSTVVIGRYLLNCLKLQHQEKSLRILEAGCGTGSLAKELLRLENLSCQELVIGDIADGMLEKAREKFFASNHHFLKDKQLTIEKADFTKFPYPDESFDRYYSNLCLHYASDPDAVISEAARVLVPGGMLGFTVWGRSNDSPMMTIVPSVLEKLQLGRKDPNKRSSFHLGEDDEALRQRFLQRGFAKCTVFHVPTVFECLDANFFVEMIIDGASSTKKEIEAFSGEDQIRVRQEVFQRAEAILRSGNPLTLDIAMIVAQK